MIDTTVHMVPEEYARMLTVIHCGIAVALAAYRTPLDPSFVWMIPLFLAVGLRSLGPVGTSFWRPLFTTAVLAGLITAVVAHRSYADGAALSVVVFVLLCTKLTTEAVGRRRLQRQ